VVQADGVCDHHAPRRVERDEVLRLAAQASEAVAKQAVARTHLLHVREQPVPVPAGVRSLGLEQRAQRVVLRLHHARPRPIVDARTAAERLSPAQPSARNMTCTERATHPEIVRPSTVAYTQSIDVPVPVPAGKSANPVTIVPVR
jgi:hypothetical protein